MWGSFVTQNEFSMPLIKRNSYDSLQKKKKKKIKLSFTKK